MKILIIEDDEITLQILTHILENANYEVVSLSNGINILEALENSKADLLITDIFMPVVDGLEVISIIKDKFPNFPIIAISADSKYSKQDSYLPAAQAIGADRILTKPIDKDYLLKIVEELNI